MIKRYKCVTDWGGTNFDATPNGTWVYYDDHAEAMQKLWHTAYTRENVNSEALATLRAEVQRWVKEVAHLKLAAEKAERERMREREVARALSLAGDDMESEGDRLAFLKKCETIIEEIEIDMQAAKELSFEPAPNGSVQGPERA